MSFTKQRSTMLTRQEKILTAIDISTQLGIEIGPLNRPIVAREMGNIRYVDHASTADLKNKYAADPLVDTEQIVDIDYVWGNKSLPELVSDEAPFDYVIASHVIEHVPDFIGWLKEIHAVLKPHSILSLVIPDKRYCFDYLRQVTQPADVVDAYLRRARCPAPRQIFDFHLSVSSLRDQIVWGPDTPIKTSDIVRLHSPESAWHVTHQVFSENRYHDVHCWVFTLRSFFELLETLIKIDLFDFKVRQFYEVQGCEFYVSLEALPASDDRRTIQLNSLPDLNLPCFQSESLSDQLSHQPDHGVIAANFSDSNDHTELEKLRQQLREKNAKIKRLRSRLTAKQQQIGALETELSQIQNSKFWQIKTYWSQLTQTWKPK